MMPRKTIIVGGGAAGLLATATALEAGESCILIEKNEKVGRKLGITGKGRCNLTNACAMSELMENIPTNPRFLYSAMSAFSPQDVMEWFEAHGVSLKVERGNRVFPQSDRAGDVVMALRRACAGATLVQGKVTNILTEEREGSVFASGVLLENGERIAGDRVIVCTGGLSYPQTGSDGDGYRFAQDLGLVVTPLSPSLCPLETEEGWCKTLMGLSLRNVSIRFEAIEGGKVVYSDFGEMLFTHFGVSGPMILSASAHLCDPTRVRYRGVIDLKPALDEKQLDARLLREFAPSPNKNISSILPALLPAKLVPVFIKMVGIDPGRKVNTITKEERTRIVEKLKGLTFTVRAMRPIAEAIVTKGGVSVKELDPRTMESRKIKGLYFAGEVIDCDAYTGGFNLQIAFATARAAALAGKETL